MLFNKQNTPFCFWYASQRASEGEFCICSSINKTRHSASGTVTGTHPSVRGRTNSVCTRPALPRQPKPTRVCMRTDSHARVCCDADIAFAALDIIAIMDPPQIPGAWGVIYSFGYVTGYHCNHDQPRFQVRGEGDLPEGNDLPDEARADSRCKLCSIHL